jgi:hypothetical protein
MSAKPALWSTLGLVAFAGWCVFIQALEPLPERGSDFPAFYTAARAPWDHLYDLDYFARFQTELRLPWGPHEVQPFPRAPLHAVLLRPFGWLSYVPALHLWLAVLSLAMLGCAWLVQRLYGGGWQVLLWMIGYYPISLALSWGQDSAFVLGPLLLAMLLHRRGDDWASAFFLSLAFQKFHLLLLVPLVLFLHGKRAWLARFACWIGCWTVLNVALIGPAGLRNYVSVLGAGVVDRLFARSWNLRSFVFHFGWDKAGYALAALAVVLWFIWLARRLRFEMAFWTAVGLSLLLAWHSFKYDYTLAFPFFYLLWREYRMWLSAVLLGGGLWVYALVLGKQTWIMAPLMGALTLLLWRAANRPGIPRNMTATSPTFGVPEASN